MEKEELMKVKDKIDDYIELKKLSPDERFWLTFLLHKESEAEMESIFTDEEELEDAELEADVDEKEDNEEPDEEEQDEEGDVDEEDLPEEDEDDEISVDDLGSQEEKPTKKKDMPMRKPIKKPRIPIKR